MNNKEYLGDLIGGSLLLTESRIIAESLLKKPSEEEWKHYIIEQNILQKKSGNTAIRYARTIRWRIECLGDEFMEELLIASESCYIQMLMMAFLINSPIVANFMRQKLAEDRRTYKPSLSPDAWPEFYESQKRAFPVLDSFSDSSVKKMGNNAIKALVDSGYLSDSRNKKIQAVYVLPEIKDWLVRLGREDLIDVMECTL